MDYIRLKTLDGNQIKTSSLGFGCEPLGGTDWGSVDIKSIKNAFYKAIDSGWNYFDTAPVYGLGASENNLGNLLSNVKDEVVVSTKVGMKWEVSDSTSYKSDLRRKIKIDSSPKEIRTSIENSLKRLHLTNIPLVFLHNPDPIIPIEESVGELKKMVLEGKIKAIGLSNFSGSDIEKASNECLISAVQMERNSLDILSGSKSIESVKICKKLQIPIFGYGTLARGILTGKYGNNVPVFEKNDRRHRLRSFEKENYLEIWKTLSQWSLLSGQLDVPMSALSIRMALDILDVDVAIVGIKSPQQVEINSKSIGWSISEEMARELLKNV
jgi:aryl-alcohol dehydrogenase-like predicted oxidoreductase